MWFKGLEYEDRQIACFKNLKIIHIKSSLSMFIQTI